MQTTPRFIVEEEFIPLKPAKKTAPSKAKYQRRKPSPILTGCKAVFGAVLGAFVTVACYFIAHKEVTPEHWEMGILVACCLAYSIPTVLEWCRKAFANKDQHKVELKSWGFCFLVEGVMTFSHQEFLAVAALVILAGINAVAAGRQFSK